MRIPVEITSINFTHSSSPTGSHFFTSLIFYFVRLSTELTCFYDLKGSFICTTANSAFHIKFSFLLSFFSLLLLGSFSLLKSAPGPFPAILSDARHEEVGEHKARWVPF